ncbi:tartrate-resistant acid phosphatase type 5 [Plakobranchus ocellatus]|uniref:Tartrate-resistant acid phosphatase type 5 n=1 Tax=Plakobranchus ocellatus TaxID=259542 RepID=A0AAV4CZ09_9GAST|nr:tartrate-resistant acid phosphatase type 5 [Plakobranchus ocellatus]
MTMMKVPIVIRFTILLSSLYFRDVCTMESLRFLTIGDMGGVDIEPFSTYFERCTAIEMGKMADIYAPQFVLELGDNFYMDGVKSVDDMRFNATYESVYISKSLQIPWYIIAGNHDHHGNVTAQILYSHRSKRWKFPDFYYYKEFTVATGNETFGIIFIDTVLLCGNSFDNESTQPLGPEHKTDAEVQWAFIEKHLKTSKANYLFTAGHYPIYSTATHGPTQCLVDRLLPMLEKYNANGHLAGHEHNLQHLRTKSKNGMAMDFFVSGMANTVDPFALHEKSVPPGSSLFHYGNLLSYGGFMYSEVTAANMTVTLINGKGKQLYTTVVWPRLK